MGRRLRHRDRRRDPAGWARELGVAKEVVDLYLASDVIDLHNCSTIWWRLGYDLARRHRPLLGRGTPLLGQIDLPRAREALTGAVWDITTNPFRTARGRLEVFRRNLSRLRRLIARYPDDLELVVTGDDYRRARAAGRLACWVAVQGGNAFDADLGLLDRLPDGAVSRVTLVHLTRSRAGTPSTDWLGRAGGLTAHGRALVAKLVERRIFVDLSHVNRAGFRDALEVVPSGVPVLVTHTGVQAVRPARRNLDDEQLIAVARTGGVVGVIYQAAFIGRNPLDYGIRDVADHMEHVVRVVGDEHLALGSDFDGTVIVPRDLPDVTYQPRLVAELLSRGWSPERIRRVLGGNYLRVLEQLRPGRGEG